MTKPNQGVAGLFLSPLGLCACVEPSSWQDDTVAGASPVPFWALLGWCDLLSSVEARGAGNNKEVMLCHGRGLEMLRDVETLQCWLVLSRASFMEHLECLDPSLRCASVSSWNCLPPGMVVLVSLVQE